MSRDRQVAPYHRLRALIVLSIAIAIIFWWRGWIAAAIVAVLVLTLGLVNEIRWRRR